jgi:glycosyltransferase involved in cell wall biosynthesis
MAKPIRVGIDLTAIWRRPTGIFRYAAELAQHLVLLEEDDPPVRYVLFFAREVHPNFVALQDRFEAVICSTTNELLLKQCWFPLILPRLHLDVMHYPAFPPPYCSPLGPTTVMTLHDVGPWRYADALTLHGRLYFRTLLTRGLHSCARVITVSEHARSEVGQLLGKRFLPKLAVIPEAARPAFAVPCSEALRQEVRTRYALPEQYFLTVATVEPRKNLVTLLRAYQHLQQRLEAACPTLVIVGRKGWNCDDIVEYMQALQGSVLFPGHVSDDELTALYQMATALVFPSLYEGFGLPVLEAMMAGCPVIAACTSSLPEVAGNAALFVDPLRPAEMAEAMQRILQDEALRTQLIQDGAKQAGMFSWEETARKTREVYRQVSGDKAHGFFDHAASCSTAT